MAVKDGLKKHLMGWIQEEKMWKGQEKGLRTYNVGVKYSVLRSPYYETISIHRIEIPEFFC